MASRKPSINTKEIIYNNAKKLFFEKGYTSTSYDEITKISNLNTAMLRYHFKNKKELAATIYHELCMNIHEQLGKVINDNYDMDIHFFSHQLVFFELIKENANFKKFYLDLCIERIINDYTKPTTIYFYKQYIVEKKIEISDAKLKMLISITVGAQSELIKDFYMNSLNISVDELISTYINLIFNYLLIDKATIDKKTLEAQNFISKLNISLNPSFVLTIHENFL